MCKETQVNRLWTNPQGNVVDVGNNDDVAINKIMDAVIVLDKQEIANGTYNLPLWRRHDNNTGLQLQDRADADNANVISDFGRNAGYLPSRHRRFGPLNTRSGSLQ